MREFKPTHISHKRVEAYPIGAAEFAADGSGRIALRGSDEIVEVPPGFTARGVPDEGDMLVRYAPDMKHPEGYLSWSPRMVFEAGNDPIAPHPAHKSHEGGGRGLSFGQAIEQLKAGDRVARDGWNGKGMYLVLVPGSTGLVVEEGRPFAKAGVPVGTRFDYLPHIDMRTVQGAFVPWLASQTDMLSSDWCVVETTVTPETVTVTVNNTTLKWYRSRGYSVPTQRVQLWATIDGRRVKNGIEHRVARGTVITIAPTDLMPASNEVLTFSCETCGKAFTTTWRAHRVKVSNNCRSCQAKKGFRGGCHSYWVQKLITDDPNAACAISGERDHRFLELHHLLSRSLGGENCAENYVILSANYHLAFHNWMGGSGKPCRPEDFHKFCRLEAAGHQPGSRRSAPALAA